MYSSFQIAKKYVRYYLMAASGKGHGIHSPFVFDFIQKVLNNKDGYEPPQAIRSLREALLKDTTVIEVEDLGAGSRAHTAAKKRVNEIAASAVKAEKYGTLLYRLVRHYQPNTIIELGTSLGVTTAYLATANPAASVVTVEGSSVIYGIAKNNFIGLGLQNIEPVLGNFDTVLPKILHNIPAVDFAYIDGNHRLQPTLRYFDQLLQKSEPQTVLVFDDIHWSKEMETAWQTIQQHPSVQCTIDVFFLGLVFFRSGFKEKQHFTIRF